MGVYWSVANLDKREHFSPDAFGESIKHPESCPRFLNALALLLKGRWSGDRIALLDDSTDRPWDPWESEHAAWREIVPDCVVNDD